jgi:hypothetical protein
MSLFVEKPKGGNMPDLLEALTFFDWISPTLAIAQNVARGPSHTFLIPVQCGWTGREISNALHHQGIKTWGHMIVNNHFMITVREEDMPRGYEFLQSAGLPVGTPKKYRSSPAPKSRRPQATTQSQRQPRRRSKLWNLLR